MKTIVLTILCTGWIAKGVCFWEQGTTTKEPADADDVPRSSFFRWPETKFGYRFILWPTWALYDTMQTKMRFATCIAGISHEFQTITTAVILNARTLITAASPLEPFSTRQDELRVWALGRSGLYNSPYRYRVWRFRRIIPRSINPEHQIGPKGRFTVRHDIAIVHTRDQIYIYGPPSTITRYLYATFAYLCNKKQTYNSNDIVFYGSGFTSVQHVKENYYIQFIIRRPEFIVNCEKYLPKWWGKFVCMRVPEPYIACIQNGGGLFVKGALTALGAFEIRYNEERIHVFTDLRYYIDWIKIIANITSGQYYDYAYQDWGTLHGIFYDGHGREIYMPTFYLQQLWPLGK